MPPVTNANPPRAGQAPAAQSQTKPQAAPPPSDFERLLQKDHRLEYEPFGGKGNIRLSVSIVRNLIAVPTKTGKLPSDNECLKFMARCQSKRMNPFEEDCYLIGYDSRDGTATFSMITAHQTYLKRAEIHPEFDGMKSGLIVRETNEDGTWTEKEIEGDYYDEEQTVQGGWAEVYFKNRKIPMKRRLRLARFKKPFGIWLEDPAGMIVKCAEADALRSSFPTMLGGLYLREEIQFEPATVKPDFKATDMLKSAATSGLFNPTPEPVANGKATEPAAAAAAAPEPPADTPYTQVVKGCQVKGIALAELLNHLVDTGAVSDSATDIEEVYRAQPELFPMILANIDSVCAQIVSGRAAR